MRRRDFWLGVGPSVVMMVGLLALPLAYSIVWSFQRVQYGSPGRWVGGANYARALTDPTFQSAVGFTVGFALVHTVLALVLGYGMALLLHRVRRGRPIFLGLLLLPFIIPAVISATAFSWLFDDSFGGLANVVAEQLTGTTVSWFTGTWPNRLLVLAAATWAALPFMMLVLLGALQGVPEEQLEAAVIDGAGWWQRQRYIVVPTLGTMFRFLALTAITAAAASKAVRSAHDESR